MLVSDCAKHVHWSILIVLTSDCAINVHWPIPYLRSIGGGVSTRGVGRVKWAHGCMVSIGQLTVFYEQNCVFGVRRLRGMLPET